MTNKIGYAYLDRYGVLHIVEDEKTAKEFAKYNGKIIETEFPHNCGNPVADVKKDTRVILCVEDKTLKVGGKSIDYDRLKHDYKDLYNLLEKLK